ncbi:MAG: SdrD B-like domain-containing protein, partial [Prochlorotrichaceae cyanobacterium]
MTTQPYSNNTSGGLLGENILGTPGDDILIGSDGNDTLTGGLGSDTLVGGNGDDVLKGGTGSPDSDTGDLILGGAGNDTLQGDSGSDTLEGGSGNDFLFGNPGGDLLNGTDSTAAGRGEVDVLNGGQDGDIFILGDTSQAYYASEGDSDYALIQRFDTNQDTLRLHGTANDYALTMISTGNNSGYIEIRLVEGGELIAIIEQCIELEKVKKRIEYLGKSASLGDTVFHDRNANGIQDAGEEGIAG